MPMIHRCPGQEMRNLTTELLCCQCGVQVEIFSDEMRTRCPRCDQDVLRSRPPSCAEWCASARTCLGKDRYHDYFGENSVSKEDPRQNSIMGGEAISKAIYLVRTQGIGALYIARILMP